MNRKRKRSGKLLGKRTHGRGESDRARGSGSRGGVGRAGYKHKKTYYMKYDPRGKHGFTRTMSIVKRLKTLNVYDLENMCANGEIEKKGTQYNFSFEGKILGAGDISVPIVLETAVCTEKAKAKIEKAGGKVTTTATVKEKPAVKEKPEKPAKEEKGEKEKAPEKEKAAKEEKMEKKTAPKAPTEKPGKPITPVEPEPPDEEEEGEEEDGEEEGDDEQAA